jgi:hypothetical protein
MPSANVAFPVDPRPPHLQTQQLDPNAFAQAQQAARLQVPIPPHSVPSSKPQFATSPAQSASSGPQPAWFYERLDKVRTLGSAAAARATLEFRAMSPERQIVIVAVGTASIAVIGVLFLWLVFLN